MPPDKALWDYTPEEIARWRTSAYGSASGRTWRRTGRPPRPRDTDALVVWGWTVLAVLAPCVGVYLLLVAPMHRWWPYTVRPVPVALSPPLPTTWSAEAPARTPRDVATAADTGAGTGTVTSMPQPILQAASLLPQGDSSSLIRPSTRVMAVPNEAATGTVKYRLAQHTGTGVRVSRDPTVPLFVVLAGAGTVGHALVAAEGEALCEMDSALTQAHGWYIVPAPQDLVGRCHAQATPPRTGYVVGTLLDATTERGQVARVQVGVGAFVPGTGTSTGSGGQERR